MQFSTKIRLNDGEVIALEDAIKKYKDFIDKEIGDEIKAPYWARLKNIESVEKKIREGSNFKVFKNKK